MKKQYFLIILIGLFFSLESCKKCKGEDPQSLIINNGTETISVHIETSGGNTININNILEGTQSDPKSFAPGTVEFTISIGNLGDVVTTVEMLECWEYEIIVDANNNVASFPTDRNE